MIYYIQKVKENTNKTRKGNCMKYTKNVVDADLRARVFSHLDIANAYTEDSLFYKINDRQYGVILTDLNGVERYVRIGAIVAEEREDMTARELMESEDKALREKKAKEEAEKDNQEIAV